MHIGIEDHIDLMVERGAVADIQSLAHSDDKVTAKYARRALHKLRSRGLDAPVPPRPGHTPGRQAPLDEPDITVVDEFQERYGMPAGEAADNALVTAVMLPGLLKRRRRVEP